MSKVDVSLCFGKHPKSETAFCVEVNLKRKADEADASIREAKTMAMSFVNKKGPTEATNEVKTEPFNPFKFAGEIMGEMVLCQFFSKTKP